MNTVLVQASRDYEIQIGPGLLAEAGDRISAITAAKTAVIVSGEQVFPLYGAALRDSMERAGFRVLCFVHPSGEQHKNLETYGKLLSFLSENRVTRSDALLALGGGVTGDLTGFAAATYQRGVDFIQIPTTLLAMVDSSVGGKTAVDLPTGKNQVGCFYQPKLVLCDTNVLETLPEEEYRCGCAEVIKYGVLGNAAFFEELRERPVSEQLEHVICTCVEMKRDIVRQDEFDRGQRQLLNLGHSFGHAVEACSGYAVLHGQAVAVGMAMITRAAVKKGVCGEETLQAVLDILRRYGLPTETGFSLDALASAMLSDKKRSGDAMNLVLPEAIGRCRIEKVPVDSLRDWLILGGAK